MSLQQKIEEIRKQPEHVRMRYVWGAVASCMFFVIILWIFSIKETLKKSQSSDTLGNIGSDLESRIPSLPELTLPEAPANTEPENLDNEIRK